MYALEKCWAKFSGVLSAIVNTKHITILAGVLRIPELQDTGKEISLDSS